MKDYSLLINEEQLRLYTPISGTFDWAYITPHIITAQDKDIQPLIGQPLFQRLLTGIVDEVLTDNEKLLLNDYIAKTLANWAGYHAYPFLSSKLVQSTLAKIETDESSPVDFDEAQSLSYRLKATANFYSERLRDYLTNNTDLFPLFETDTDGELEQSNDKTHTFGFNLEND